MKPDIYNRSDIEKLVKNFYEKVREDELLGKYFTELIPVVWEKHLPLMCDFWESVLFYTGSYKGNPLHTHRMVYEKRPTTKDDFDRWNILFFGTVDELFKGKNAEKLKSHAKSIGDIMQKIIS